MRSLDSVIDLFFRQIQKISSTDPKDFVDNDEKEEGDNNTAEEEVDDDNNNIFLDLSTIFFGFLDEIFWIC